MRIALSACAVVAIGAGVLAGLFWRQLDAERQASRDLQAQLDAAHATLAAMPVMQPLNTVVVQGAPVEEATPPTEVSREAVMAAVVADAAKVQKTLLEDDQYRNARLEQARLRLRQRYAGLAEELGLSEREMNALIDLLAEHQMNQEGMVADLMASGVTPDATAIEEINRRQQALQGKQDEALVALLGPARHQQFQEFEMSQPSRTRVSNLGTLLAQGGRPLTEAQKRSLTAVIVAEQKRQEREAAAQRGAGQDTLASQPDRVAEGNRRILEAAAGFLDTQQLEMVRGRFEQRSAMGRATNQVQQRVLEATQ